MTTNEDSTPIETIQFRWLVACPTLKIVELAALTCGPQWPLDTLRKTIGRRDVNGQAAVFQGQLIGFSLYRLEADRIAILALAVHPDFRRQKVGTQLMARLLRKLAPLRRQQIWTVVDDEALNGQLFLQQQKFKATEVLKAEDVHKDFQALPDRDYYRFEFALSGSEN